MPDNTKKGIGDYIVSVLNGMAQGLFSSLIIGLIIKQIGTYAGLDWLASFGQIAQCLTCPAIGIGVAYSIGAKGLALFAAATAGTIGGGAITIAETGAIAIASGEPLGACIAALIGALCGKLATGRTKADIIIVPLLTILAGGVTGLVISPAVAALMNALGALINHLTTLYPLPMGILVSAVVGMVLTLPISSAAICISLGLSGLAAGAACAGCSAQMIGFAFMSFRENGVGGLISQGLGTSMLPGTGNQHAPDSEHLEELEDLDTAYGRVDDHWSAIHMRIQDDEQRGGSRDGHKRLGRTVQRRCRDGSGVASFDSLGPLHPPRTPHGPYSHPDETERMDKGRRPEASGLKHQHTYIHSKGSPRERASFIHCRLPSFFRFSLTSALPALNIFLIAHLHSKGGFR